MPLREKEVPRKFDNIEADASGAGKAERGLDLILIPDPGSRHCTIKDLRERGKDVTKHSKLIKQK